MDRPFTPERLRANLNHRSCSGSLTAADARIAGTNRLDIIPSADVD